MVHGLEKILGYWTCFKQR